jgi:methylglyoxal synthase
MTKGLHIGLVAHDQCKPTMIAWAQAHQAVLAKHSLVATGTTGGAIAKATGLEIERLMSGPQGGDAQLGARIAEGGLDVLIFFIDPLSAVPHDVDVKALIRLATLHDLPFACNRASADALMTGTLFTPPS